MSSPACQLPLDLVRRAAWPTAIALLVLACGCRTATVFEVEDPAERDFLIEVLTAPASDTSAPADLDAVPALAESARRGVVKLRSNQSPRLLGYFGLVYEATAEALREPSLWNALGVPTTLCLGWILEFFRAQNGTGFIVAQRGSHAFILTNAHVVGEHPDGIELLTLDGRPCTSFYGADLLWADYGLDAALLRVDVGEETILPLALGTAGPRIRDGYCLALGYPGRGETTFLGMEAQHATATLGLISSYDVNLAGRALDLPGAQGPQGYIQTDAAINPGNSGGPLVDLQGRVLGINSYGIPGRDNLGFAVPIDWVRAALLRRLREAGDG